MWKRRVIQANLNCPDFVMEHEEENAIVIILLLWYLLLLLLLIRIEIFTKDIIIISQEVLDSPLRVVWLLISYSNFCVHNL